MPTVLAVDVGLINLALVSVLTSADHEVVAITDSKVVDVTRIRCPPGCRLQHTNNIVDRMNHFFQAHGRGFEEADEILIEAQPVLVGFVHVEALIFSRYRHKASLVQPVAVQKHFGWPRCSYDLKKQAAVDTASPFMPTLADVTRKHDLADAFCLVLYTCQLRQKQLEVDRWMAERRDIGATNPFGRFKFQAPTF